MQIVYVMILISCSGHTNTDCTLEQRYFNTFKECADAQWVKREDFFGNVSHWQDAAHRICLATPKSEATFQ